MSDLLWPQSAIAAALADHQIACGVICHPVTNNWQTWFSLYGTDITCIFASQDDDRAHRVQQLFLAELRSGGLVNSDRAKTFIADLPHLDGSERIDPLPQRNLETLAQQIRKQITVPPVAADIDDGLERR
jgi:hypothetical protein